jgi:phosphoketolase
MTERDVTRSTISGQPLDNTCLQRIDACWRAANHLSIGQVFLVDNPLLRKPQHPEYVKKRLLAHWGTMAGLNFVDAHLNHAIVERDQAVMHVVGPGTVARGWWCLLPRGPVRRGPPLLRERRRRPPSRVHAVLVSRWHP